MRKRILVAGLLVLAVLALFIFGLGIKQAIVQSPPENEIVEKKVQKESPPISPEEEESVIIETEEKTEPEHQEEIAPSYTCSLVVRCDAVLDKIDKLDEEKMGYVPSDGIIFLKNDIEFDEGDSVFDVLKRELNNSNIHLDAVESKIYRSVYVKGIANLYEFDCGDSGWIYTVNGESPMHGCSEHKINKNDMIEFVYICR